MSVASEAFAKMEAERARQEVARQEQLTYERKEAARHVLWFNGDPRGMRPGSFTEKLISTWARADQSNSARLDIAFPVLGQAVEISRHLGSDAVAAWAGIER